MCIRDRSGKFYLYNVEEAKLRDYSVEGSTDVLPKGHHLFSKPDIIGVTFNPLEPEKIVFYSHEFLCRVDLRKPRVEEIENKSAQKQPRSKKSKKHTDTKKKSIQSVKFVDKFRPILYVGFADDGSMIVIERPWLQVMESLPSTLYRPRYGSA
eukprot:TRINITY_DN19306_c0_g1_i3.p1 TRINITY_DN19306_c0_g1~~TRINITY_DN19306_c0_g1_i3.p1  ORF type:complete len:153 (-),score=35.27 TRINITY_DN19306_c0_g1_i3:87-545(-)